MSLNIAAALTTAVIAATVTAAVKILPLTERLSDSTRFANVVGT
jgi:hypothetical protein